MPLQNRVSPFGELFASPARGTMFGNRGGKFHRDDRTLGARRFASRQWICCVLKFKNRQRDVWGRYYTELFFLDEATALAAGHRPCFECRREDAVAFAAAFAKGQGLALSSRAPDMDRILHGERLDGHAKRLHRRVIDELPDSVFITLPQSVVSVDDSAAGEPSPREAAGRVASEASGVGGVVHRSDSLENVPPPLTPPTGRYARLRRAMHFAALNGGRGTPAASAVNSGEAVSAVSAEDSYVARAALAVRGNELLCWTPAGYGKRIARPRGILVDVLTPPSIIASLAAGYRPQWHDSAA